MKEIIDKKAHTLKAINTRYNVMIIAKKGNIDLADSLHFSQKSFKYTFIISPFNKLIKFLANYAGQVFSREALLEKVWGYEYFGDMRTVDVTVRRLREKIENNAAEPDYILTKRGVGYYFKK